MDPNWQKLLRMVFLKRVSPAQERCLHGTEDRSPVYFQRTPLFWTRKIDGKLKREMRRNAGPSPPYV